MEKLEQKENPRRESNRRGPMEGSNEPARFINIIGCMPENLEFIGAWGENRTRTGTKPQGILSPLCLPIPSPRHVRYEKSVEHLSATGSIVKDLPYFSGPKPRLRDSTSNAFITPWHLHAVLSNTGLSEERTSDRTSNSSLGAYPPTPGASCRL